MTLRLSILLTLGTLFVVSACGPKLPGTTSSTGDLTAGTNTTASTGEESTTVSTAGSLDGGMADLGKPNPPDLPPPDLPPKGCEGVVAPGETPSGMRSAWAYTAANGNDLRIQLSSLEPECGEPPAFPECETSWSLNLNLPPGSQDVGLYEITESNDVRASCSETIGGEDVCAGTGGGDADGFIEIVEITETCIAGQVYGLSVCSSFEGAFVAGRC